MPYALLRIQIRFNQFNQQYRLVRMYLLVDKKQVEGVLFPQMRCSGLCAREPRGWFVRLRVLSGGNTRDVAATA